jgi:hypothetical protein
MNNVTEKQIAQVVLEIRQRFEELSERERIAEAAELVRDALENPYDKRRKEYKACEAARKDARLWNGLLNQAHYRLANLMLQKYADISDAELAKLSGEEVEIIVNGRMHVVPNAEISYEQVKQNAFANPVEGVTVIYTRGHGDNPNGILTPGKSVMVKAGMCFDAAVTNLA